MIIYGNDVIYQKNTSNISSNPKKWSHSWAMGKPRKTTRKMIDEGEVETTQLCWENKRYTVTVWQERQRGLTL